MPIDTRCITFTQQELGEALLAFCRTKGKAVPETGFAQVRPSLDTQSNLVVSAEAQSKVTTFAENEIAAAIILYCLRNKIPLPRNAKKSLALADDGGVSLNLTVRAGSSVDQRKEVPAEPSVREPQL